ncbi:MAG: hypothetical protein ABJB66_17770 [Gemmatimonadaceae bacterium]
MNCSERFVNGEVDATLIFDPGEIYDFEYTPTGKGELSLTFGALPSPPPPPLPPGKKPAAALPDPTPPTVKVAVHVR